VGSVQGNIEQSRKNRSHAHQRSIKERYLQQSERARKAGADLLVWPEAAWPGYLSTALERLPLSPLGVPLILGSPAYTPGDQRQHLNSAFHIDADGNIKGRYDKVHLVPFGEYVPLRALLPVEKFVPGLIDFSAGASFAPIGSPPAGALICFDGVFPRIARQEVLAGAEWLVNLTNDGWYGISSAPYQHLDFYVFRAIENARFVVRAANTGISAAIGPRGDIIARTRLGEQTYLLPTVAPLKGTTLYTRFGDWVVALSLGGLVAGAVFRKRGRSAH
jgi:apolipoprotein N-acyltransferase